MTNTGKPEFYRLTVTALEDLHIGTGTGQGDVDAHIMRDRSGLPVIRASHIEGLLRQAGEELVGLKILAPSKLDTLLGAAGNQKGQLRMTSLRTKSAATLVWGSTKREPGKRQPQEDTLRLVEYVAAGTEFEATLRLPGGVTPGLLERLLNRIDRIGGGRNRGAGLVKLEWNRLDENPLDVSQPRRRVSPPDASATRIRLLLRNLEPLCLPLTGYPGNLIRTQSFIRGQALRGAFISWLLAHSAAPHDHDGRGDSTYSQVSFGDALPLPENMTQFSHSLMPIPLSIMTPKSKGSNTKLPWWADSQPTNHASDDLCRERGVTDAPAEKMKRPGAHEYLCRNGETTPWQRHTPVLTVALRNQTADKPEEETKLFSLEEIAENTLFQAELRFQNPEAVKTFCRQFDAVLNGEDWLMIGRGGQPVVIDAVDFVLDTPADTSTALSNDSNKARDTFCLTLTSDAIVRGPYLGFLRDLSIEDLCCFASISCKTGWEIKNQVVETETIHGFNAVSGLQRAAALAIRRGSCWWIMGPNCRELASALAKIPALGERVREGFGRFVIDAQPIPANALGEPDSGAETELPENAQENRLRTAKALAEILLKCDKQPSPSQLQWLRNRALACSNQTMLEKLLKEVENAPKQREKSGAAWKSFPLPALRKAIGLENPKKGNEVNEADNPTAEKLAEKKLLIAHFVEYAVMGMKLAARETKQNKKPESTQHE